MLSPSIIISVLYTFDSVMLMWIVDFSHHVSSWIGIGKWILENLYSILKIRWIVIVMGMTWLLLPCNAPLSFCQWADCELWIMTRTRILSCGEKEIPFIFHRLANWQAPYHIIYVCICSDGRLAEAMRTQSDGLEIRKNDIWLLERKETAALPNKYV
jgi:hypothetical protein